MWCMVLREWPAPQRPLLHIRQSFHALQVSLSIKPGLHSHCVVWKWNDDRPHSNRTRRSAVGTWCVCRSRPICLDPVPAKSSCNHRALARCHQKRSPEKTQTFVEEMALHSVFSGQGGRIIAYPKFSGVTCGLLMHHLEIKGFSFIQLGRVASLSSLLAGSSWVACFPAPGLCNRLAGSSPCWRQSSKKRTEAWVVVCLYARQAGAGISSALMAGCTPCSIAADSGLETGWANDRC
ncbi:hypothetical protein GGR62_001733 [Xanthomonas campestris]|nr:hypothetical protein [Xanthomonas sp. 3075]